MHLNDEFISSSILVTELMNFKCLHYYKIFEDYKFKIIS